MLKSRPMGDGKQLYGNLRLDSKLVLLELGNSLQTIRLVGVRIVICTALLMTYDSDVWSSPAGDEWFKQDGEQHVAQQKRQYQLLVDRYSCAVQRPDHTRTQVDVALVSISMHSSANHLLCAVSATNEDNHHSRMKRDRWHVKF